MDNMWSDLQQTFYICLGPFFAYLLLPAMGAAGVLIAIHEALFSLFNLNK